MAEIEEAKVEEVKLPSWRELLKPSVEFKKGYYSYAATQKDQELLNLPNPRKWKETEEDWKLPPNWKEIVIKKMDELRKKYRSFHVYIDICVRCGACADKCQFYIGTQDPKNMPVVRAELLRSVYRRYFTLGGKIFKGFAGARELTEDVLKEWYIYFYQCSECRRCSVFCPYGIDTAEITMMARELLNSVGISTKYVTEVIAKAETIGNNLGLPPAAFKNSLDGAVEDIYDITGIEIEIPLNKKGAEILYVGPSADFFGTPHWFTGLGLFMLFEEIGLDYTLSTYASEGGNFGFFHSYEHVKKVSKRIIEEAKRLGVKWILGGECGHQWRIWHQYLDTLNGPLDFLEEPVSPITGTKFENAAVSKYVHIHEFVADLIKHNKIKLDPSRNNHWKVTFHDSCNVVRGMGMYEEPRYVIRNVCNNFVEMPEHAIKEKSYCCGGGGGLLTDELMEVRMRGGMARAMAVKQSGANFLACICAIDKAQLTALMKYWVPEVQVGGVMELVGNALIMEGEKERTVDLRGNPIAEVKEYKCILCGAIFKEKDECCEHAEKEHKIAKAACDMPCKGVV